jgi:predicted amidophosphoribosyltransferase
LLLAQRVGRTASQVGLTADQRRRNVAEEAFKVNLARASRIEGKRIVVIDDVITTWGRRPRPAPGR